MVTATLVAVTLLSACSEDPEPKIDPDPTPTVSTSAASASASPTTSPTAAALGPGETVAAWVEARNAALQDGDTTAVRGLSAEACSTCEDSIAPIDEVYASGGRYETEGWSINAAKVVTESAAKAKVNAGITYEAGTTLPEAGGEPITYGVEKHIAVFRLAKGEGVWRVSFIGYLS